MSVLPDPKWVLVSPKPYFDLNQIYGCRKAPILNQSLAISA
jgi:hypothetical protein